MDLAIGLYRQGGYLQVPNLLLVLEVFQHLDGCPHLGRDLECARPLGKSHRGAGVPERIMEVFLPPCVGVIAQASRRSLAPPDVIEIDFIF